MNVYVVVQKGVYRHDLVGVFVSEEEARKCADAYIRAESDDYHTFQVVRMVMGVPGEALVCTFRRVDAKHYEWSGNVSQKIIDSDRYRIAPSQFHFPPARFDWAANWVVYEYIAV